MSRLSLHARPTVAFLTTSVSAGIGHAIWLGAAEAAEQLDLNLVTFVGGVLRDPTGFAAQANVLYRLAETHRVDGFIIWGSSVGGLLDRDEIAAFHARFRPRPIVSIALPLEGIPTLTIDSYRGMHDLVRHLIETHHYRRLAFIRGPETHYYAQERLRAYADVLAECGIPFEPQRVSPPLKWDAETGARAVRFFLEERHLDADAIIAANDTLALGAIAALQARQVAIPQDMAVVGFNDGRASRISTPPLTSVALPFRQQGYQAVKMLDTLLHGGALPEQTTLTAHLVVRQSCGCPDPDVVQAMSQTIALSSKPFNRDEIIAEMVGALDGQETASIPRLFDTLLAELAQSSHGGFLQELEGALSRGGGEPSAWQGVISALRRQVLAYLEGDGRRRAEDLCHQARILIEKSTERFRTREILHAEQQATALRDLGAACTTAADVHGLLEVLEERLPGLGIQSAYVVLYDSSDREACRLMLAFDESGRVALDPAGAAFRSADLFPDPPSPLDRHSSFIVEPLYFHDHPLGYILLQSGPREGPVYETLGIQISSALQGVQLLAQNVELYHQALAADALKSRFLSMVSHELLTPIVLLVGLSEMMLKGKRSLPESYRQDLIRIYTSAQHLGTLVRDVLDLARSQVGELRLVQRPFDLHDMLQAVALVGEEMAHGKGLEWRADIPRRLPDVLGDAARLQQVALNLVTNAVKFTAQGEIGFQVDADDRTVTVRVSDTGVGVPLAEQHSIFDEFRQSERTSTRGYGGLGIGLAICRRLVELHGGTIGVESSGEENGGSTFYFTLPVLGDAAPSNAPLERVLVITASARGSAYLKEHLVRQGFEVDALDIERTPRWQSHLTNPPGAVVLDAALGAEFAAALKQNPTTEGVPVLLCSISPDRDRGSVLTIDSLRKPVGAENLLYALRRYGLVESGGQDKTILVADDDPGILEMHSRLVQSALPRCRVVRVPDGARALEAMQQTLPALVLLDLMMPGLDGFGVLEAMQENERTRRVPVIILTARALTEQDMARLSQGAVAILEKGVFSVQETLAHIEQALALDKRLGTEAQRVARRVMAHIHQHYGEPLTREQLAACAGVSVRHLNRCFGDEMGLSPMNYLLRYRITRAKRLLQESDQSMTEVAASVGFSSSSYFAEVFRKVTGKSPSEFRAH